MSAIQKDSIIFNSFFWSHKTWFRIKFIKSELYDNEIIM